MPLELLFGHIKLSFLGTTGLIGKPWKTTSVQSSFGRLPLHHRSVYQVQIWDLLAMFVSRGSSQLLLCLATNLLSYFYLLQCQSIFEKHWAIGKTFGQSLYQKQKKWYRLHTAKFWTLFTININSFDICIRPYGVTKNFGAEHEQKNQRVGTLDEHLFAD